MATEWLDLHTPPALPGLLLRAASRRGITGKVLPHRGPVSYTHLTLPTTPYV